MRTDRRQPSEIQALIDRKVRVTLTAWEKLNIKTMYEKLSAKPWNKSWNGCAECWRNAISSLAKGVKNGEIQEAPRVEKETALQIEVMDFPKHDPGAADYEKMNYIQLRQAAKDKGFNGKNPTKVELIDYLNG